MRGSAWLDVFAGLIKDDLWLQTENNTMQQCTDISRTKTTERSQVNSFSQRLSRTLGEHHVNLEEDHLKEQFNLNVSLQPASIVLVSMRNYYYKNQALCLRYCHTYHCGTCPQTGTSESDSIGTCFGSSFGSYSGVHTCRTPVWGEWSDGRNPTMW